MSTTNANLMNTNTTMRAAIQDRYGPPSSLRVGVVELPNIETDEVLIRVHCAGIDRGTWHLLTGLPLLARLELGLRKPKRRVPGFDVAGTVVAVGAGVTQFSAGDEVCGIAKGSMAEYAAAKEGKLALRPTQVPVDEAGAIAISGLTALQALRKANVKAGSHVLVNGASGGVGTFAVQIAVAMGATATAACSSGKAELVRSLGAHTVIDYAAVDPLQAPDQYDAILDIGGGRKLKHLQSALKPGGTVLLIGNETGGKFAGGFVSRLLGAVFRSVGRSRKVVGFIASETGVDVATLMEMMANSQLRVVIDRSINLGQVVEAMDDLAAGRIAGKISVRVDETA